MKKAVLFVFAAAIFFCTSNTFGQTKEKKSVDVNSAKVEKSRGENPNIKQGRPTTDTPVAQPEKTRGDNCILGFDNYTGYYIDVYVDGIYRGTLDPWESENRVTLSAGYKTIYCVTTGGTYEWKNSGNCESYFYFKLKVN
ncbi:MAG: hypothetical protein PHD97_12495 [Bacteroidales bacterium]|nr:hypothetical protein [Bacteroidales bacterium]